MKQRLEVQFPRSIEKKAGPVPVVHKAVSLRKEHDENVSLIEKDQTEYEKKIEVQQIQEINDLENEMLGTLNGLYDKIVSHIEFLGKENKDATSLPSRIRAKLTEIGSLESEWFILWRKEKSKKNIEKIDTAKKQLRNLQQEALSVNEEVLLRLADLRKDIFEGRKINRLVSPKEIREGRTGTVDEPIFAFVYSKESPYSVRNLAHDRLKKEFERERHNIDIVMGTLREFVIEDNLKIPD